MRNLITVILIFSIGIIGGCSDVFLPISPIISAYVAWKEGEAHAYFATDRLSAYKATLRAVGDLGYNVIDDTVQSSGNHYVVVGSNDRFKIKVVQIEPYVTRISIRVNFMGDKPYAELIYKHLEGELDVIDYKKFTESRRLIR